LPFKSIISLNHDPIFLPNSDEMIDGKSMESMVVAPVKNPESILRKLSISKKIVGQTKGNTWAV
jgi:hypothetical protein